MELFSKIPGDDLVISRIQTLDESQFGYPDFVDFHLAQFVLSNIECCEELLQLNDQIYLLIWLACKVDQNSTRSSFDLVEFYAHLIHSDVMHLHLAQFLDEVAETITEVIPAEQREKELSTFAYFLTNDCCDDRPFAPIIAEFRSSNKCCSWLQEQYVAGIIYLTSICALRKYFITSDRLFRKIARGLQDVSLGEEDWLTMLHSVHSLIPEEAALAEKWEPFKLFKETVYQPGCGVDDRVLFIQMCTLFRDDWKKIWTLMCWTKNRRTVRELLEFRSVSKVRPKQNTSATFFFSISS